jgi:hypothetical protein
LDVGYIPSAGRKLERYQQRVIGSAAAIGFPGPTIARSRDKFEEIPFAVSHSAIARRVGRVQMLTKRSGQPWTSDGFRTALAEAGSQGRDCWADVSRLARLGRMPPRRWRDGS